MSDEFSVWNIMLIRVCVCVCVSVIEVLVQI